MCGISGVIVKGDAEEANKFYYSILRKSDIRGQNGTGVTVNRTDGKTIKYKYSDKASLVNVFPTLYNDDIAIGQNRLAIFGADRRNNQPIQISTMHMIHNGNLHGNFGMEFIKRGWVRELDVDTELILRFIYESYADSTLAPEFKFDDVKTSILDAITEVKEQLPGNFACLMLYSTHRMLFAFAKYKPLYIIDINDNIYFFSTLDIAKRALPFSMEYLKENAKLIDNDTILFFK